MLKILDATIQNVASQAPRISAPLNCTIIAQTYRSCDAFVKKEKENMDRIKVEPDSQEESSLAAHSEGNFICIKEEYIPEEPLPSQDPENVSFKSFLYSLTHKMSVSTAALL